MQFYYQIIMERQQVEARKLIPYYMIDFIYKTVTPSHLKKLQILEKIKSLMLQIIFVFSD